jgi:transposase
MVVMVGIDVHKDTHCAVAVDQVGAQLGAARTFRTTDAGNLQLLRWAQREHGLEVTFAVEDCRHLTTRLERALLAAGARVLRVPPKLMAGARQSARTRGKSDPIDALAIARAALREPNLPVAEHTHASREIKLLADHREDLVAQRTQVQNRLRWHLHELDPTIDPAKRALDRTSELDRVHAAVEAMPAGVVRRIALELVADIRALTVRINGLEKELRPLVLQQAPQLLDLPGCGVHRREDPRRDREPQPVPVRGPFRDARRSRAHPSLVRPHQPPPAGPRRQPPAQLRAAPHRRHPDPPRRPRPRLLPTPDQLRRHQHGSPTRPQGPPRSRRVQPAPAHPRHRRGTPAAGGLT